MTTSPRRAFARLSAANPVPTPGDLPQEWRERLLDRIDAEVPSRLPDGTRRRAGARLVFVALAVIGLLSLPSYGVARDVIAWVRGEPAPQAVVEDFGSYAPQLGFRPDARSAILVAVDEGGVRLYATTNDRGSYCLMLAAPERPSGDGGTCIEPRWAAEPLIAGTLGATAGDETWTHFVAGRSAHPGADTIVFSDPAGRPITVPVGFDGFFVAAVQVSRSACGGSDWRPTFVVLDRSGNELARAAITLLFSRSSVPGVCSSGPPHPPSVR